MILFEFSPSSRKKWGVEYDDGFIFRGAFLHGACTLYITQNGVQIFSEGATLYIKFRFSEKATKSLKKSPTYFEV